MTRTLRASTIIWKTVVSAGAMLGAACGGTAPRPAEPAPPPVAEAPPPPVEAAPPPVEAEPPPVAEAPAPPPEPEPPPTPESISVRVTSKPAGAEVYLDGKLVGKTPLDVQVPYSAAEVNLKVKRKGYVDEALAFTADSDQELAVELEKPAKRPRGVGSIGVGGVGHGGGTGKGVGRGFVLS